MYFNITVPEFHKTLLLQKDYRYNPYYRGKEYIISKTPKAWGLGFKIKDNNG